MTTARGARADPKQDFRLWDSWMAKEAGPAGGWARPAFHGNSPACAVPHPVPATQYLKKLHTQERAVEEVKLAIKPYYQKKDITKDEYKDILRKAVHKVGPEGGSGTEVGAGHTRETDVCTRVQRRGDGGMAGRPAG